MNHNDFGDEIWDERQWETHLNEIEEKSEVIKQLISVYSDSMPRWMHFVKEYASEDDAIDAYIDDELMIEEAYFPDDDDDLDDELDEVDDFFLSEGEAHLNDEEEDDEGDDGESWKSATQQEEMFLMRLDDEYENLEIFDESRDLAAYLIKRGKSFPDAMKLPEYELLITRTLDISCRLASGYSFGFELDVLGATITYCKKALLIANECLALLQELKAKDIFHPIEYQELHSRYFTLRNTTGLYLQELRDLFKAGGTDGDV